MIYTCHVCGLKSKLNVLLSSHFKKHASMCKDEYKKELLIHNDRAPKTCSICLKETKIPKGEKEYPRYHRKCYLAYQLNDKQNPNYKGGKTQYTCRFCNKGFKKHSSAVLVDDPFCSSSCSTTYYYCRKHNMTPQDYREGRLSESAKIAEFGRNISKSVRAIPRRALRKKKGLDHYIENLGTCLHVLKLTLYIH